jgi:DNA primase
MLELAKRYTEMKKVGVGVWQGKCPHPTNHTDKTPSFVVWEKSNSWSCMGCHSGKKGEQNFGSDAIAFLQWVEGLKWRDAVLKLAEYHDIQKPSEENDKEYQKNLKLAQKYCKDLDEDVIEYLVERGLDKEDIKEWLLGYDSYQDRIVFPLIDKYKNILGFNRRIFNAPPETPNKYKNSPNSKIFNKSTYFYGIHNIDYSFPYIRITEGCMDVILAKKYGLKNIVATLGTSFTEDHAKAIKKIGLTPVLIYDGDKAGDLAREKVMNLLNDIGIYCKVVIMPKAKDLADMSLEYKEFIEDYISSEAVTYGYSKLKNIVDVYNKEHYELKLKLAPKLTEILKQVPDAERAVLKSYLKDEIKLTIE